MATVIPLRNRPVVHARGRQGLSLGGPRDMAPGVMNASERPKISATGIAVGRAGRHHGEILQGLWWQPSEARADPIPCLVTLPVPGTGTEAHFRLTPGRRIVVHPTNRVKAARAARLALDALDATASGGLLHLNSSIPIGLGMGSSTSDVLATLRAVCDACGAQADATLLAQLAVRAEAAADPLMFDSAVLFAQREGHILEDWGRWFPDFLLLSIDTEPRSGGHDTLGLPVPNGAAMRDEYTGLVQQARAAFQARDADAVAAAATRSAELNQRIVPLRGFEDLRMLAATSGALGLQISHSGTVAGLLFDPLIVRHTLKPLLTQLRARQMAPLGIFRTGCDTSGGTA